MKWLSLQWYQYIFEDNYGLRNILCRMRGHPHGIIWYNIGGDEPNMCCKDCGEDLG